MKLLQDSSITLATSVAKLAVAMITGIILARALGPEGRGQLALLLLIPIMIGSLGDLGVGQSSVYLLAGKRVPLSRVVTGVMIVAVLLSAVAIGVALVVFSFTRGSVFQGIQPLHFYMIVSAVPAWLLLKYVVNIYRGIGRPLSYNLVNFLEPVTYLILIGLLFAFGASVGNAVIARIATLLLIAALAFWLLRLHAPGQVRPDFDADTVKGLASNGAQISAMLAMGFLNRRIALFFVNGFLGNTEVGYYVMALTLAEVLWILPDSVGVVLFPKISASTPEDAAKITARTSRYVLLLGVAGALVVAALAKPTVTVLYGGEFAPAVTPLLILLPGIVAFSLHKVIWRYLMGRGRTLLSTYSRASALVITVGLSLILIPRFGAEGAALATSLSYGAAAAIMLLVFRRISGIPWSKVLVIQNGDVGWLAHQTRLLLFQWAGRRAQRT